MAYHTSQPTLQAKSSKYLHQQSHLRLLQKTCAYLCHHFINLMVGINKGNLCTAINSRHYSLVGKDAKMYILLEVNGLHLQFHNIGLILIRIC
jgi:hypothetical protein